MLHTAFINFDAIIAMTNHYLMLKHHVICLEGFLITNDRLYRINILASFNCVLVFLIQNGYHSHMALFDHNQSLPTC